ncbi:MAG: YlxR family protein [Anaerolineae bacterium]|nr:YlxR family protein [Anaerolineae bacterium]
MKKTKRRSKGERSKSRHIPERTCIVCRSTRPKRELIRVVRLTEGGVVIDETGKLNGRGAYLCRQRVCWEQALKRNALNHALRVILSADDCATLQTYAASLPERLEDPGIGRSRLPGTDNHDVRNCVEEQNI